MQTIKKYSIYLMFAASATFAYVSFVLNKSDQPNTLATLFGPEIVEGASCGTVVSCATGTGTGSGTSTGTGSGTGTSTSGCSSGCI